MKDNSEKFSIEGMAEIFGVSRSGYYTWLKRPESSRSIYNRQLLKRIREISIENRGVYGGIKIHKTLLKEGFRCSLKLIYRLMKEDDIRSITVKKFRACSNKKNRDRTAENILNRKFKVSSANQAWVSDITYIHTLEGWFYLCVIIDLFSRQVVGWSGSKKINTELVVKALNAACMVRRPPKGLVFHSDRGAQYTSDEFQKVLRERGFECSMSRKGNCWDNAVAESFFRSLKVEEVYQKTYRTREEANLSVFSYIEMFYNRQRIHSYLGYLTPAEFEAECA